jgi:hypothetical protein
VLKYQCDLMSCKRPRSEVAAPPFPTARPEILPNQTPCLHEPVPDCRALPEDSEIHRNDLHRNATKRSGLPCL